MPDDHRSPETLLQTNFSHFFHDFHRSMIAGVAWLEWLWEGFFKSLQVTLTILPTLINESFQILTNVDILPFLEILFSQLGKLMKVKQRKICYFMLNVAGEITYFGEYFG